MGLLDFITETARAERAQDDKYLKSYLYFFELRVPASVAKSSDRVFIYPLILAPESYRMTEPFAIEKTMTNGSGLWVEENGIIARELHLSGTTGWKPRAFPRNAVSTAGADALSLPPSGASFSRKAQFNILEALSGQKHFQFLQDAVFRTYADLKRDLTTAGETELFFHNPKDSEHWRVHPMSFEMERTSQSQNLYKYNITLLCSEPASARGIRPSDDFTVLEALKNVDVMLNFGVNFLNSGINDLIGVQDELRRSIQGIATILEDASALATSTTRFLEGTATLIDVPYAAVLSLQNGLDTTLTAYYEQSALLGLVPDVDGSVLNTIRKISDSIAVIGSYPEKFQTALDKKVAAANDQQELSTSRTQDQLDEAARTAPPSTLRGFSLLGTALLPGDAARASNELGLGRNVPRYRSARAVPIERGDTLANLAGRYLGDARLWKFIAIFNDLTPPYISPHGFPGTLNVGDDILIPSTAPPQAALTTPGVLGVTADTDAEERTLGRDFGLYDDGTGFYDWAIDVEGGSVDAKEVAGIPNLKQAIRSRLLTHRGEDILYKTLGVQRVVGLGITLVDLETAQIRLVAAVEDDPRVAGVRNIQFQNGPPADALFVEMDVEVRGLQRSERVTIRK